MVLYVRARACRVVCRVCLGLVLLRMSTNRESATDFMDARYFADLVYDKWIFDVPKIFDICTLYGSYNAKVLILSHSFFSLFIFPFFSFFVFVRPCAGGEPIGVVAAQPSAQVQGRSQAGRAHHLPRRAGT